MLATEAVIAEPSTSHSNLDRNDVVDLGRTGRPGPRARTQHEQHRDDDERNGWEKQHGGRDQKDRNDTESKDYAWSKSRDISFLHTMFEEAIVWPGRATRSREQTSMRWTRAVARSMQTWQNMRLTSSAFTDGGEIPIRYTCEGADVSPPLSWGEIPKAARSLALIVDDPDAPDPAAPGRVWVHWVVVDLPPDAGGLAENVHRLAHGRVGRNDWSWNRWNGPCPAEGRHRYVFKLYALDRTLELAYPSRPELERAMAGHILAEATLVGTYEKRRR